MGTFQSQNNYGDNYGVMLEGFVKASETGSYKFFTSSDDASEVWVSSVPGQKDVSMVKVVELTGCCQEVAGSTAVSWEAGQVYYVKAYMKEGGGGDYLKVGMQRNGGSKHMPIPISMFELPAGSQL